METGCELFLQRLSYKSTQKNLRMAKIKNKEAFKTNVFKCHNRN